MKTLSLFAGIGGADIALERLGLKTYWFSEIHPYASSVFAKRFPDAAPLGDVREIQASSLKDCECIVGGFPCQDISAAGTRAGIKGKRSGLWAEFARLIAEVQPTLVFIENVSALYSRGLNVVLDDLAACGYDAEWDCLPAAAVGAPHLRDRIWIVAWRQDLQIPSLLGRSEELLGTLEEVGPKLFRAGRMHAGGIYESEPIARRRTKRLEPGRSIWIGVDLASEDSVSRRGLWPTPSVKGNYNRAGGWAKSGDGLATAVYKGLWPTPKASPSGPDYARMARPRSGGDDLATAVARVSPKGQQLNPEWVEWLMGFPIGWTDLECEQLDGPFSWTFEPDIPRVGSGIEKRKSRISCLGNSLVPQVMGYFAGRALDGLHELAMELEAA